MRRFNNLAYFFLEGFRSIFTHGLMSFAAVCMIVCCLLIMGSFSLVAVNLDNMWGDYEKQNEFLAFVDETYTEEQARALQSRIEAIPNVASAAFVSKEQAKEDFAADKAENELFEGLPDTVFRDRFRIHVVDLEQLEATVEQVGQITGVVKVNASPEIAQGFVVVRNIASGVALILVGILLLVSLFIITNTIKLATFNRRDEIAIMKMVGATNGFIRWPFVYEGLLLGLFSAVIAFGLQWGLYAAVAQGIANSDSLQILRVVPFTEIWYYVALVFLGAGILVGVGGSLTAIRRFLRV